MNYPAPFTVNQKNFFNRCFTSWFNVAEGGKRGGKNVLLTMAFCAALEKHPGKLHLVAGVSNATTKLNILDCDGFGLINYFEGRCREGKYKDRDCLYIKTQTGEKIILVSGGGKKGDEKLIKGNTYGMAYITEANECHPSFIQEVFDRTLSSADRKIFHDLNPKAPKHWYYTDVLDFHESQQRDNPEYGYNFGHFTIADNMSISDSQLKSVLATYDKTSVWYERDILGKRKAAEGLVYPLFANNSKRYIVENVRDYLQETKQLHGHLSFGVDFGGTGSATAFIAVIITRNWKDAVIVDEEYITAAIDPKQLNQMFAAFVQRVTYQWGAGVTFADSAEQVLIRGMKNTAITEKLKTDVKNARKLPIHDRIRLVNLLLAQDRLRICRSCKHVIEALADAVYDDSKIGEDIRLDNGTSNIDSLDAFEYSLEPYIKNLTDAGFRR